MTTSPYDNLPAGRTNQKKYDASISADMPKNNTNPEYKKTEESRQSSDSDSSQTEKKTPAVHTDSVQLTYNDEKPEDTSLKKTYIPYDIESSGSSPSPESAHADVKPPKASTDMQKTPEHSKNSGTSNIPSSQAVPFDGVLEYSKSLIKNRIGIREYILPFDDSLLVPDTMPDMKKIFFTEGRAVLSQPGKTAYSKGDMLSGEIILYTVYHPDSTAEPIDVVKSRIPFQTDRCWGENENSSYRVSVSLKTSDSELINERKFHTVGEISIKMTEITKEEIDTLKPCSDENFICLKNSVNAADLDFETEEISEISETIKTDENHPSPVKILKEDINISETHRQISAGKLIINAIINSRIMYKGTEDDETKICSISGKTDFTQFIPMKTEVSSELIKTDYDISGLDISIENNSGFLLEGQVRTKIQGYKNEEFISVSDAYHKEKNIDFEISSQKIFSVSETASGEISAREVINTEGITDSPRTLLCSSAQSAEISAHPENSRIIIEGSLPVKVLGLDSDEKPFTLTASIPIRGSLDISHQLSKGPALDIWFSVKDIWADTINSRQIEINAALSIEVWVTACEEFLTIENAVCIPEETSSKSPSSMNIYVVGKDDTLWDIAKKYKSDEQTIADLNQIDISLPLPEGVKLFISR